MASVSGTSRSAEQSRYEAFEAERAKARSLHEEEVQELKQEFEETESIAKKESDERLVRIKKEAQEEIRQLKEDMYDRQGKRFAKDSRDLSDEREQVERYKDQVEREYKRNVDRLEKSTTERIRRSESDNDQKTQEALDAQKRSHRLENQELRETVNQLSLDPREVETEKAQARSSAIQEVEGKAMRDKQYLEQSYDSNLQRVKMSAEEEAAHLKAKLAQKDYENLAKTQKVLIEQKRDFLNKDQQRVQHMKRLEDVYQQDLKKAQEQNRNSNLNLHQANVTQSEKALQAQQQTLNEYYAGDQKRNAEIINQKEQELRKLKHTQDEFDVSPALVSKIKQRTEEKSFREREAERLHHENQVNALGKKDATERLAMKHQFDQNTTQMRKELMKEKDLDRNRLQTAFQDMQDNRSSEVANLREGFTLQSKRNQIRSSQEIENQRIKAAMVYEQQREDGKLEVDQVKEEARLTQRDRDREWMFKYNDLRRGFEKKIFDLQDEHEVQTSQLKLEYESKLKEQERNLNRLVDDRVRTYEYQLKQQELSFKEKERFITEQYATEMDKLKRTHARLIQKKS